MVGKKFAAVLGMLLGFFIVSVTAQAEPEYPLDNFIACEREAEVRPTNVKVQNAARCKATAVIQGISYRCSLASKASELKDQFVKDINKNGKKRCETFCKDIGNGCDSKYYNFDRCITVEGDLDVMGKKIGCHPTACEGRAFVYCSIFRGSFFRIEEKMYKDQQPNCYCREKK